MDERQRNEIRLLCEVATQFRAAAGRHSEGIPTQLDTTLLSKCKKKIESLRNAKGPPRDENGHHLQGPSLFDEVTHAIKPRVPDDVNWSATNRQDMFDKHILTISVAMQDVDQVPQAAMLAAADFLNNVALGLERYIMAWHALNSKVPK